MTGRVKRSQFGKALVKTSKKAKTVTRYILILFCSYYLIEHKWQQIQRYSENRSNKSNLLSFDVLVDMVVLDAGVSLIDIFNDIFGVNFRFIDAFFVFTTVSFGYWFFLNRCF